MGGKDSLYIAIDSGASNTRVLFFKCNRRIGYEKNVDGGSIKEPPIKEHSMAFVSDDIEVLERSVFEGFNYSVSGVEGLREFLDRLRGKLLSVMRRESIDTDVFGEPKLIVGLAIAGIGRDDVKKRFAEDFKRAFDSAGDTRDGVNNEEYSPERILRGARYYLMHDGESALWGVFPDGLGIVVNAGTGSIALGRNGMGKIVRSGGWGHIVDDEGSAYWIAVRAISLLLKLYDGRDRLADEELYGSEFAGRGIIEEEDLDNKSILKDLLLQSVGLDDIEEIVGWIHGKDIGKADIAALARVVTEAALRGDRLAIGILTAAGRELFFLARSVIERLKEKDKRIRVGMMGSVFAKDKVVRDTFIGLLKEEFPDIDVFLASVESDIGAARCLIYRLENGYKPDIVL